MQMKKQGQIIVPDFWSYLSCGTMMYQYRQVFKKEIASDFSVCLHVYGGGYYHPSPTFVTCDNPAYGYTGTKKRGDEPAPTCL